MIDMQARNIIEALRSGIPSRAVGQYFSDARPQMMKQIYFHMEQCKESDNSSGMIFTGKYGEGKTHILNTVFSQAQTDNMVVSTISLSKETPMNNLPLLYQKIIANTYLPDRQQPGLLKALERLSPNSPLVSDLLLYASKELQTDKLYYVLRSYLNTEDQEERFQLQMDLEGNFIGAAVLKKIYRRIFNQAVKFNTSFSKTKHTGDYFSFMSYLFKKLGYNGWVILFDEAELIGRLTKTSRMKAYANMAVFLKPEVSFHSVFSLFAFSSSYEEDVIEGKHEYDTLQELYPENPEPMKSVLNQISKAPQLNPLNKEEMEQILAQIQELHGHAYHWNPSVSLETLVHTADNGYLLRTKIRSVIELLDQLYQYGEAGKVKITELGVETFEEDETPSLEDALK